MKKLVTSSWFIGIVLFAGLMAGILYLGAHGAFPPPGGTIPQVGSPLDKR